MLYCVREAERINAVVALTKAAGYKTAVLVEGSMSRLAKVG